METKVIEQMRSFADISAGLIKSFVDETEQVKAENANLVIELEEKKKQLEQLERLKEFEKALTKFQDNADEIGVFVNTYYYWEKGIARPASKHMPLIQKFISSRKVYVPSPNGVQIQ